MDLSQYLLAGFNALPKSTATIGSSSFECVYNTSTHKDKKTYGGFEPLLESTITAKTSDLVNPKTLRGIILTVEETSYRIAFVNYGKYLCTLSLIDPDAL